MGFKIVFTKPAIGDLQRYQLNMNFGILFERITEKDFPPGAFLCDYREGGSIE